MIKETISISNAIIFLNELVKIDSVAMRSLIEDRVRCKAEVAEHPTAQVNLRDDGTYKIGLLGIVNGLFGCSDQGWGPIAAVFDLVCPSCTRDTAPGQVEGDKCESCGAPIKLDCLSGFHRTTATLASEPGETN